MASQTESVALYFAFADGVFHHVCAECTALCCRGQGFAGSLNREMGFIFQNYPQLGSMVMERQANVVTCATPAGQCFFLRGDNLCQIEVEHGRSKKPGVCMLFPFNDFYRIGNTVAVAPHFMCPLRLTVPAAPGQVEGTHSNLTEAIRETGLLEPGYVRQYVTNPRLPSGESAEAVVCRETAFRDRCAAGLGRKRFHEILEENSSDPAALSTFRKRVSRLMAWSPLRQSAEHDLMDNLLLAIAPALRLDALQHTADGLIRFLTLAELLARLAFSVGHSVPTLQGVYGVVDDMRPAIRLLAWADEAPVTKKARLKSPAFGDPNLIFAGQTFLNMMPTEGVLTALENVVQPALGTSDRTALIHQLAGVIDPASKLYV